MCTMKDTIEDTYVYVYVYYFLHCLQRSTNRYMIHLLHHNKILT